MRIEEVKFQNQIETLRIVKTDKRIIILYLLQM